MASDPFLVPIANIRHQPGVRVRETRRGRLGDLAVTGSRVGAGTDVEVDVVLEVVDGGIVAEGQVRAPWQGECCRCLTPVDGELAVDVRELYRPRRRGEAPDADEETYPLGTELLDLRPLARDAVLLGLPLAPHCRPDCAGLCPRCGADLNAGACGCPPEQGDPRWAALDVLRQAGGDRPSPAR
jgi:uncharacterized protein